MKIMAVFIYGRDSELKIYLVHVLAVYGEIC